MTSVNNIGDKYWPCFMNEVSYEEDPQRNGVDVGDALANVGDKLLQPLRQIVEWKTQQSKSYTLRVISVRSVDVTAYRDEYKEKGFSWVALILSIIATVPGILIKGLSMLSSEIRYKHRYTSSDPSYRPCFAEGRVMLNSINN